MKFKEILSRACPKCGIEMIPPPKNGHKWACSNSPENCDLIYSTFSEYTGLPKTTKYEARPRAHYIIGRM